MEGQNSRVFNVHMLLNCRLHLIRLIRHFPTPGASSRLGQLNDSFCASDSFLKCLTITTTVEDLSACSTLGYNKKKGTDVA